MRVRVISINGGDPVVVFDDDGEGTMLVAPTDYSDESEAYVVDTYGQSVRDVPEEEVNR